MDDRTVRAMLRRGVEAEEARPLASPARRTARIIGLILGTLGTVLGTVLLGAAVWLHSNLDTLAFPFVFGAAILGLVVAVPSLVYLLAGTSVNRFI